MSEPPFPRMSTAAKKLHRRPPTSRPDPHIVDAAVAALVDFWAGRIDTSPVAVLRDVHGLTLAEAARAIAAAQARGSARR